MRERNTLIARVLAGTAALGISASAVTAPAFAQGTPAPSDAASHSVGTPDIAGGLARDPAGEGRLSSTIGEMRQKINSVSSGRLTVVSAFYKTPGQPVSSGAPAGVIFVGGAGGAGSMGDPASSISGFRSGAGADRVTEVDAGHGGGKAACAETSGGAETHAYCFWATTDSFGLIVPTYATTAAMTGDVMRKMRPDLETAGQPKP